MVSMKIETFEFVGKTENRARLFFKKACWKNGVVFCTRCRSRKVYRIAGKRYWCKSCKYTFHDFSGRWIGKLRIPFKKWLWIIKFFEVELSARKIAQQVGLSYGRMVSPIIWTTIATGNGMDKHGIIDFLKDGVPVTANLRKTKAIWNILSDNRITVGIVGYYVTWV